MDNYRIKILKDTPFHRERTVLSLVDFRAAYSWICTASTTTEQLIKYLQTDWRLVENQKIPYQKNIGEWFQVIEVFEEEPLVFVHEDLWYVKGFDGMYAVFVSPMFYKEYIDHNRTQSACVKKIHIQEARTLIKEAKFKKNILYCTNDVNKKL